MFKNEQSVDLSKQEDFVKSLKDILKNDIEKKALVEVEMDKLYFKVENIY